MIRLIVLAGGFGTRLRTTVTDVPKALAPVEDAPFLRFQLENWINQGIRRFTFLLHHKADQIVAFLRAEQNALLKFCDVHWLVEPAPMDTGGAIAYAVDELGLNEDFLVTNADTWLGDGVRQLMENDMPSVAVVERANTNRYGSLFFGCDRRVSAFKEKDSSHTAGWINAGLYKLSAAPFKLWDGKPYSLERQFLRTLAEKRQLIAVPLTTSFIDIGIPEDYRRFVSWISSGRESSL